MSKRWMGKAWRWLVGLGLLASGAWLLGAWLAAGEISQPNRRPLEAHHQAWLSAPGDHGLRLEAFTTSEGTPVLLCRPDSGGKLDERGTRLRDELQRRGVSLPAPGVENGVTLVLLHGRRGRKEDNLPVAMRFCAAGFRCLLPDLPGHGEHAVETASYGPRERDLPGRVLREAANRFGFADRPAGLWGISMGGSVAVHAAAGSPQDWDALVVVASFDALGPVIRRQCEQRLGHRWGALFYATVKRFHRGPALDGVQPAAQAWQVQAPTLIAHGDDDPLIPQEAARRLFEAVGAAEKKWVNVGSGTHGNVLVTSYPLYAEMAEWMLEHAVQTER